MKNVERQKIIKVLKVLLQMEDVEIIHCTLESLIDELEEKTKKKSKG